jgi:hypothetical protein
LSLKGVVIIILAMDELSTETKREIVKLIFPDLRYGGDPDIERYFELRKDGRLAQALSVYNGTLRVRYPDDSSRVLLLKLFRERDPRYASYQDSLMLDFAGRLSLRIRHNIDLITSPLERADLSDALRALKAVESVLSRLPGDTEGALALLARYDEFARVLGYRQVLARRALELVREYDAVSRADSPADYDFVARSAALEEKRRGIAEPRSTNGSSEEGGYDFVAKSAELERRRNERQKDTHNYFDPARIKFSKAEIARVEISPDIARREDKVLAFCAKYWPYAADQAFERMVFLYSRKYGGRHFEIFRAIKIGRARRATDDEILSAVSGILTTSYNYSVSGDLYMQIMWRRLRGRMEERAVAERLAKPGPVATTRAKVETEPESRVRAIRQESQTIPPPPAGDAQPTRIRLQAGQKGNLAAPPSFALKETSSRGTIHAEMAPAAARAAPSPESRVAAPAPSRAPQPSRTKATLTKKPPEPAIPKVPQAPKTAKAHSASAKTKAGSKTEKKPKPRSEKLVDRSANSGSIATGLRQTTKAKGARLLVPTRSGPEPLREIKAKHGSISDSIRKLSGRGYDVYKEIFLEKVRDHIHRGLLANQTRTHGLFDTAANEAEDQVYGFIVAHYDDPFMDWERSAEREVVEALGFSMPSLEPIIKSCYEKL